jgi:hypothetical protein
VNCIDPALRLYFHDAQLCWNSVDTSRPCLAFYAITLPSASQIEQMVVRRIDY